MRHERKRRRFTTFFWLHRSSTPRRKRKRRKAIYIHIILTGGETRDHRSARFGSCLFYPFEFFPPHIPRSEHPVQLSSYQFSFLRFYSIPLGVISKHMGTCIYLCRVDGQNYKFTSADVYENKRGWGGGVRRRVGGRQGKPREFSQRRGENCAGYRSITSNSLCPPRVVRYLTIIVAFLMMRPRNFYLSG